MYKSPFVTLSSPASIRNIVVFPQPDGPSNTTNSPSAISSERSSTTFVSPKVLVTFRNPICISKSLRLTLHCSQRQSPHQIPLHCERKDQNGNHRHRARGTHHAPFDLVLRHASRNSDRQRHRRIRLRQHERKQKLIPRNDQTKHSRRGKPGTD